MGGEIHCTFAQTCIGIYQFANRPHAIWPKKPPPQNRYFTRGTHNQKARPRATPGQFSPRGRPRLRGESHFANRAATRAQETYPPNPSDTRKPGMRQSKRKSARPKPTASRIVSGRLANAAREGRGRALENSVSLEAGYAVRSIACRSRFTHLPMKSVRSAFLFRGAISFSSRSSAVVAEM